MDSQPDPQILQKLNEQMYRQNAELVVRNKTLTILRQLSTQSLAYLDVPEVSQSIVNTLSEELGVAFALISLTDKKSNTVQHKAITRTDTISQTMSVFTQPLAAHSLDTSHNQNLLIKAMKEKLPQQSTRMFEILQPFVTEDECKKFEEQLSVSEYYILPILLNEEAIGVLTLGLSKPIKDLSTAERESLEQITQIVGLALDRAWLYEETIRTNEKLRELDKLKDEFLSVASHDLRTPMTAMKGYLWLMLKKINQLPPDMAEKLRRIYNSSERMIALINDMLDVSRIESGRIKIVLETFDIVELAKDVEQELQGQAADEGVRLVIDGGSHIIRADRNRTHEVLVNLIGNALKFTPEQGSISVKFEEKGGMIATHVTDTGIGIAPQDLPKLFEKFSRIDTSSTPVAQVPGTGLGLFICKKIIELSGGLIGVQSEVGKGSTFSFSLPKG